MVETDQNPGPRPPAWQVLMGSALAPSHPRTTRGRAHLPQEATGSCRRPTPNSLRPHNTPVVWRKPRTTPPSWHELHAEGSPPPRPPCQGALADRLHKIHTHTAEDRCDLLWHTRPSHCQSAPVPQQGWLVQLVTQVSLMSPCPSGRPAHPVPSSALLSLTPLSPPLSLQVLLFCSHTSGSALLSPPGSFLSSESPNCQLPNQTHAGSQSQKQPGFPTPILWNLGISPGWTDAACAQSVGGPRLLGGVPGSPWGRLCEESSPSAPGEWPLHSGRQAGLRQVSMKGHGSSSGVCKRT